MGFKKNSLAPALFNIIINKATEHPFTEKYNEKEEPGTYLCRQCGFALFRSHTKFHSHCGWPSFDEEIADAVARKPDIDGHRIEIICARCDAHLGHIFKNEGLTDKNTRFCVNSLSLDFVNNSTIVDTEEAIFAAGCFWGVESLFKQLPGILKTEVGYSGGKKANPTYEEVCQGNTGHYEVIRVIYDQKKIDFTRIATYFFEIHDPTQEDGQGPDRGEQYLSVAFYYTEKQKNILNELIAILKEKGLTVVTKILPVSVFWPAEQYHQKYYTKTGKHPYCHVYKKRFG